MTGPFRVRSFRFQWPADLLTSWATEMETLILGWYVMVDSGSVLMLTAFGSLQSLGTLASPVFGMLGDRLGVRTMLCTMRAAYVLLAAAVTALAAWDWLTPVWVLAIATLTGIVRPNDLVMRNALIGETIPPPQQMGALGFSRASQDSARVAGALAGAGLSAALGIGTAYVFVTLFYAASFALTFGVARSRPAPDPTRAARGAEARPSPYRDVKDGLVHVATTPALLAAMLLAFLINISAYPVTSGLLPYVAREVYTVDSTGLGWLVASFGLGALAGSIVIVATGGPRRPERAMIVYAALWYALLLGFGAARDVRVGLALMLVIGFVQSIAMISLMATMLAAAEARFRTRVMGARQLAVYGMPLGLMAAGVLIGRMGWAATVGMYCAVGLVFTLAIGLRWRGSLGPARRALTPSTSRTA
ncbi:MAG: MFS transporter [Candidatus Rokubacteria bacterium]|nr:MFS transporter [Candidatus Rokubacteria bacterium]